MSKWYDMMENSQEVMGFWVDHSLNAESYIYQWYHKQKLEWFDILENIYSQDINNIYIKSLESRSWYIDINSVYQIENKSEVWSTNQIIYILDQFGLANNISQSYIYELWKFILFAKSGYKKIGDDRRLYICHGFLYIVEMIDYETSHKIKSKYDYIYAFADANKKNYRLQKIGDRFHGKSINEYLSNRKVPVFLRPYVVLQVDQNDNIIDTIIQKLI